MPQKRAKTGCFSCRKRRVKCDEAKPECQRCKAANVHCEGYPAKKVLSVNGSEKMLERRLSSYSEGPLDVGNDALLNAGNVALPFYHQFITQTVYAISGGTRQKFWREDVARMAWSTDYVYHAMISLAAMHKSSTDAGRGRAPAALRTFALQNYQQAIKLLSRDSNAGALKPIRVLATLTLFSYFEVCDIPLISDCKISFSLMELVLHWRFRRLIPQSLGRYPSIRSPHPQPISSGQLPNPLPSPFHCESGLQSPGPCTIRSNLHPRHHKEALDRECASK